jgi:tetratricopeptide (TPR) repeat protein
MDRLDELLTNLNREVIEARNATIKAENSLKNLAGDIRQVSRRHEHLERRIWIGSIGAYVLFATLSFAGALLFFRAALGTRGLERELVARDTAELQTRVEALENELERVRTSEREAWTFYELLASDRRTEVLERWPNVQGRLVDRTTIELFRREIEGLRHDLAREAFDVGLRAARAEQWTDARDAFARSVAYVETAPYSPTLHFHLAEALYHLAEHSAATRYYDLAIESGVLTRQESILALFHRAEALQRAGREAEAVEAYRAFERRFGDHYWAATARDRIARLGSPRP